MGFTVESTVQYSTVQYSTVQYSTVFLHCIALHFYSYEYKFYKSILQNIAGRRTLSTGKLDISTPMF